MKAAVRYQYGPPESLKIEDLPTPVPKAGEVLVRVHATTVNRTDCALLTGFPLAVRAFTGFTKPTIPVTGTDFAGQVAAVGQNVTTFQVGDKVWGFNDNGLGSHAQYLCIPADAAMLKIPEGIDYAQAAASAEAAHYAINFMNKVTIQAGQHVLLNGASGGIGSAALQILLYHGVVVTAVCGSKNVEKIRALGAHRVIDFEKEDFTKLEEPFDFVLDAVGKSTFFACKHLLKPGGIYISSELGPWWQNIFLALVTPIFGGKKVVFPLPVDIKKSLIFMQQLLGEGKFRPLIDRSYPLEHIQQAFTYVRLGQKTGNVILTMS